NRETRAGIAGASALGMLQSANGPGKSSVSAAVANFKGQSAVAVGYSRSSDNNKIQLKFGASVNTNSDVNLGGSIGYHW
ncbi:MAG: YadA C-terminal domain-containing protein, partial [Lonepinella koalarum]|nr:YadA C-terminal domain-containing protein [Lonepinella koalarum]